MQDMETINTGDYEVVCGNNALSPLRSFLKEHTADISSLFILTDKNSNHHCLPYLVEQIPELSGVMVIDVDPGEESKSIQTAASLWRTLAREGADRRSLLINLGGGVVGDLGSFVASTFKRGIRFINIPTTLLAMVDASAGGKTGLNLNNLKNQVGTFSNPKAIYIDPRFLSTLSKRNYLSGFAEIIKHALIADRKYWKKICNTRLSDFEEWCGLIVRSIEIKADIVSRDYHEQGERKLLNFGHTFGHAIETYSFENDRAPLLHGEAVAVGMICAVYLSEKECGLSKKKSGEITAFIHSVFKHYKLDENDYHKIIEYMQHDKKKSGKALTFILLEDIGKPVITEVSMENVIDALNFYQSFSR